MSRIFPIAIVCQVYLFFLFLFNYLFNLTNSYTILEIGHKPCPIIVSASYFFISFKNINERLNKATDGGGGEGGRGICVSFFIFLFR